MPIHFRLFLFLFLLILVTGCGLRKFPSSFDEPIFAGPLATISEHPAIDLASTPFIDKYYISTSEFIEKIPDLDGYSLCRNASSLFIFKEVHFGLFFFYDYNKDDGKHLLVSYNKENGTLDFRTDSLPDSPRNFKIQWDADNDRILIYRKTMLNRDTSVQVGWEWKHSRLFLYQSERKRKKAS